MLTGIGVTNDGNAILRELDLAHPAAKVSSQFNVLASRVDACDFFISSLMFILLGSLSQSMIELSRTQDEEVGDGTTSVIVLGMVNIISTILWWNIYT